MSLGVSVPGFGTLGYLEQTSAQLSSAQLAAVTQGWG